jgi:hypothetical protein
MMDDHSNEGRGPETGYLDDTPAGDNVLWGFVQNQIAYNELLAVAAGGRAERGEGVASADSSTAVPYLNQSMLSRPLLDASDDRLDAVERFFTDRARPATLLSVWPTPDLSHRGWTLVGHPAFVVRPPGPVPTDIERPGVEIHLADTPEQLAAFERVIVEGYPIHEADGAPSGSVFDPSLIGSAARYRVGLVDGAPAAGGASHVGAGVVNLCLGATLPAARRRGVWQRLVWERVGDAPDLPAVAFTSDFSRPGFVRMGFAPVLRFTLWIR